MRLVSGSRARGRALLLASTLLATAAVVPAFAQSTGNLPPPTRYVLDPNGVNLATGEYLITTRDLTIGSGEASLSLDRNRGLSASGSAYESYVYQNGATVSATVFIGDGSRSYTFTKSGSTYVSQTGEGATLTGGVSSYILTLKDGSIYTFGELRQATYDGFYRRARLTSIQTDDGVRQDIAWSQTAYCSNSSDNCRSGPNTTKLRLQSVTNSFGYQLHYDYASNLAGDANSAADWAKIVSVTALNLAVDYCAPMASACTLSRDWPKVSYSGDYGSETVTDSAGRVTKYDIVLGQAATGLALDFKVKRPSSTTANTVVSGDSNQRVVSVTTDGRKWSYAWASSGNLMTATITNPDTTQRVVVSDITVGLPVSVRDELNRTTAYEYDTSGRVTRITAPEGNSVTYTYDTRGNVTETRGVSKTPGTPADIVTTASYPDSCANPKTCNQPEWTKDAKGNQTDYTYDPTHGGVLTATGPAGESGVRPQTRYGYASLQAYYKDADGALVASGVPTWRLTSSSTCRTLASCPDTADEVKTTIDYGPQSPGTSNNLLPISTTTSAGDASLTATTSTSYDAVGNQVLVDGPLIATADTVRTIYDAARQPIGVIGPDPDATGALPNRATRYSYNLDGQVTRVERGTTAGQSDDAWNGFSPTESVETTYDPSGRKENDTLSAGGTRYAFTQYTYDARGRLDCVAQRMNASPTAAFPVDACALGPQGSLRPSHPMFSQLR